MTARFYGVGLGPGDPELMTLKACRVLEESDVLCVPKSSQGKDSIALAIVQKIIKKHFEVVELLFPMVRDTEELMKFWEKAADTVGAKLGEGKKVAFISIGDPLFYSTSAYLMKYIKEKYPEVPVQIVPGVTSVSACMAALAEPLVEGNEKLAVIPAAYPVENLAGLLGQFENVVLMKVNNYFDRLVEELKRIEFQGKTFFVSRVGHSDQFCTDDLDCLVGKPLDYMSMVILRGSGR